MRCFLVLFAMLLCACSPPAPGTRERLQISDRGEFSLNGRPIARDGLQAALAEEQRRHPALFAEISASPKADIETVRFAIATLQSAQVRFAFVDDKVMGTPKPQGAAAP